MYLLFREHVTRSNLVTLLLGTAGILVIFGGAAGAQDLQGVTVALGSGFMLGVYFVNLRFLRGFDPFALMLANNGRGMPRFGRVCLPSSSGCR